MDDARLKKMTEIAEHLETEARKLDSMNNPRARQKATRIREMAADMRAGILLDENELRRIADELRTDRDA